MSDGGVSPEVIVPSGMERIHEELGYAPAVRVGDLVFCAGQVGRDEDLKVIHDPEAQFRACWRNLERLLKGAGCGFEDVVDLVSYHVNLGTHYPLFKQVKNELFPKGRAAWTAIGVSELSRPGLLVELKATAVAGG
ncbi:MAG: RidA family protein [Flavobacteriaceae bacterium]